VEVQSQIYVENNYFVTDETVDPSRFISRFNGTLIFIGDTCSTDARRSRTSMCWRRTTPRAIRIFECRDVDTVPGRRVPPDTGGRRRGQEYGRDVPRRIGAFGTTGNVRAVSRLA
jgi:hypothetical protein